ncbi:MAG: YicC family protein [Ignavibacteria bacterium]|nr:YicC family protein [Ignavibacteria bacterium]
MIISMTGFGRSEGTFKGRKYYAEIRSVNNKYSDIGLRYPRQFASYDLELKEIIRKKISRGKISVTITSENQEASAGIMNMEPGIIKKYVSDLKKLNEAVGSDEKIKLEHIISLAGMFSPEGVTETSDSERKFLFKLLENAVIDLNKMKKKEGDSLKKDISDRINFIKKESERISALSNGKAGQVRKKLREKINSILTDKKLIDENRLETEIILYSERIDITEELIRLKSHLKYFTDNIKSDELSGRRLNFLVQEINREVNTIASKSMDAEISQKSVEMKEELEKIREQLQNVE